VPCYQTVTKWSIFD